MSPMGDLCPNCGLREQDTPSGFCSVCVVDRVALEYSAKDRARAEERRSSWTSQRWGDRYSLLKKHRRDLARIICPRVPMATFDPWAIAVEALENATQMGSRATFSRPALEDVCEAIRRLAWGPDEGALPVERPHGRRRIQLPGQLALWPDAQVIAA